jgi:hypothetical protein
MRQSRPHGGDLAPIAKYGSDLLLGIAPATHSRVAVAATVSCCPGWLICYEDELSRLRPVVICKNDERSRVGGVCRQHPPLLLTAEGQQDCLPEDSLGMEPEVGNLVPRIGGSSVPKGGVWCTPVRGRKTVHMLVSWLQMPWVGRTSCILAHMYHGLEAGHIPVHRIGLGGEDEMHHASRCRHLDYNWIGYSSL